MQQALPWILASVAFAVLAGTGLLWLLRRRTPATRPLPTEWLLSARPVFNSDERRVHRQLREALPHHVVLSKLPLVRFCQPTDPGQVRFWYDLLGAIHVTFAICSANGRVLAAIDLDSDRAGMRRSTQIKQSVLAACRVRYLRCPVDHLPSLAELQLLVPHSVPPTRGPQPAPPVTRAREPVAGAAPRRGERAPPWPDSGFFHDSFFNAEGRDSTLPEATQPPSQSDAGGVVVDAPPPARH